MGQQQAKYETLTVNERKLIVESWALLRKKLSQCGLKLFTIFFEDCPKHTKYFKVRIVQEPDKREDIGLKFMREISRIVNCIDVGTSAFPIIQQVAKTHGPRNIELDAFTDLRSSFLKMLNIELSNKVGEDTYKAWNKALELIFTIIYDVSHNTRESMDQQQSDSRHNSMYQYGAP